MTLYTYVVDHGEDDPIINALTKINGGEIHSLAFGNSLARLAAHEEFVAMIYDMTADPRTQDAIDEFRNGGSKGAV